MRRKLPELGVYVFGARCVWRLLAAPMEQSDHMTLLNEPLHHERANEPGPAQGRPPDSNGERTRGSKVVIWGYCERRVLQASGRGRVGLSELNPRLVRQARNEALFREVNERIEQLGEGAQAWSPGGTVEFFCECGEEGGCGQRLRVPLEVYERVRAQDDRFIVKPGHETPELERSVARTDEYLIVDKLPQAEPLVEDDPRGAPSS